MCDIEVYNEKQWREPEQIFKKLIGTNCFLKLENIRDGMASNRELEGRGEFN